MMQRALKVKSNWLLSLAMTIRPFSCLDRASLPLNDVYIALGSNMNNRAQNIIEALRSLRNLGVVKTTSYLYESEPMYHLDQSAFMNAACHLKTSLEPIELLSAIKSIESSIGRTASFRNGPRLIDIDIILYGDRVVNSPSLEIPHPRMCERGFVLRPLCDINMEIQHPLRNESLADLLSALPIEDFKAVKRVVPINKYADGSERLLEVDGRFYVCGILNATPDRFVQIHFLLSLFLHLNDVTIYNTPQF